MRRGSTRDIKEALKKIPHLGMVQKSGDTNQNDPINSGHDQNLP